MKTNIMEMKSFFLVLFFLFNCLEAQKFILDADTGNEMDDLYALVKALKCDEMDVIGVTSSHFNNTQLLTDEYWHIYPTANINTVKISQELNEKILGYLNKEHIPHPIGCDRMVGYSWGYYDGAPIPNSPAVEFIIETANKFDHSEKLNIICLGAVTNIAAAILRDTSISSNIRLYILSMSLTDSGAWNKNSFNARNDINALDIILNDKELELIVIPGNVSRNLVFERKSSAEMLSKKKSPLNKLLLDRWDEVSAGETWIMWDLALVEFIINPEVGKMEQFLTPPENTPRKIDVISEIDPAAIEKNFWECLLQ
jgi:inosine-uridine nucleoside N-ribohydrolase